MAKTIVKAINFLLYGLVLLVPLVYFTNGMYPFQVIKTVVFQSLVEIIFALWLALAILYKEYRPQKNLLLISLAIFVLVITLSSFLGTDWRMSLWSEEARTMGVVALYHFFGLFLVLSGLKEKVNWKNIWTISFIIASLVALAAIVQKFFEFQSPIQQLVGEFLATKSQGAARVSSTFGNAAFMAGYLLFNIFIGLWILWSEILKKGKQLFKKAFFWILLAGIILITTAIFFSQTAGAILGFAVGIFILVIYFIFASKDLQAVKSEKFNSKKIKKTATIVLCVLIALVAIFWVTKSSAIWQDIPGFSKIAGLTFESSSVRDRLITWKLGLEAFKDKPILGWGFENFRNAFDRHYNPNLLTSSILGTYWDKPHNVVLEYLVNTGILGLLSYFFVFISVFYLLFKNKNQSEGNIISFPFLIAVLAAYFAQNLFIFDTIGTYLMFFLALGFIGGKFIISGEVVSVSDKEEKERGLKILLAVFVLISLIGIYYNYEIFDASRYEYWGVNYFLNLLPESSMVSFSQAINTVTPYADDIKMNYANTVKQAFQQGVEYPNLAQLQSKLNDYMTEIIKRRPSNYFYYVSLAEYKNVFSRYNPNYLKEAEELVYKALEISPKRQQVYYILAKTKLLQNDPKGAYEAFEKAVALNPDAADPHFYFGLMAYGLGDAKKGLEEITIAENLGRKPQKSEEAIVLGNFMGDYQHDYKKAIELYKSALVLLPPGVGPEMPKYQNINKPNIILKLAIAYYLDGDFDNAKKMFIELSGLISIKSLPIYPDLKPVLQQLNLNY